MEGKLLTALKITLYSVFIIPLIYATGFFFPFIITKVVFFRLAAQIGLTLYFLLLIIDFDKYKPKMNTAFVLVLLFLSVNFIAALFGLDFYRSFWSDFERMEGVVGIIYLSVYFFLLINAFREEKDWINAIRVILAASFFVSLYGIIQKFDLLPVFEAGVGRAASTLGNAAFLAGYLLLAIGLGAYNYLKESDRKFKYATLLITIINVWVLFLTSTRGAILGLAIGALVWLLINVVFAKGRAKKYSLALLLVILSLGFSFYFAKDKLASSDIEFVRRMATISMSDATVKNRIIVWRWAIDEFKERPILGVGPENFNYVYNKYFTPEISEDWFDRTHNIYLDQLVSSGVFGLLAYLSIFIYALYALYKRKDKDYYLFVSFFSLLAAYFVHNFFVFDVLSVSLLYFFIIAYVSFKYRKEEREEWLNDLKEGGKNYQALLSKAGPILLIVLAAANVYAFYKLVYRPLKINKSFFNGYYYVVADPDLSYSGFKYALSGKYGSSQISAQLYKMFSVLSSEPGAKQEDINRLYELTRNKLQFAVENHPLDIRPRLYLGQLIINNSNNQKELEYAEKILKRAVELSPGRPEAVYLLYNVYLKEGKNEEAVKTLKDFSDRLPWFGEVKIMLANALRRDNPEEAKKYFDEGIKQLHGDSGGNNIKIIEYLLYNKRYKDAIPFYLKLIEEEPDRLDYRIDLSKLYYLQGDIDKAVEEVNIVNSRDPEILKRFGQYVNLLFDSPEAEK